MARPSSSRRLLTHLITFVTTGLFFSFLTAAEGPIRHIVIFKYAPGAAEAQIQEVTDEFRSLKDRIPGITGFEHGVNNSRQGKNLGFTHVYLMTFQDEAARDAYLPHPEHEKFKEFLANSGIFLESFVVDWIPQE